MRQGTRRGVVVGAVCAVWSVALAAGEPVDRLENGGFEEGLAGWSPAPGHELVRDTSAARSGDACLTGEVTQPSKALILRREVRVRAGCRYEFEIWARATRRTKLVLWVVPPNGGTRRMVASWPGVPARWRRYSATISPSGSGPLRLEIVAPSSFGEPPGRMWIDDVSLREVEMPPVTDVSGGDGFCDDPDLCVVDGGALWVAWIRFRDGAETLRVARYTSPGGPRDPLLRSGAWDVAGGPSTRILGARLVRAGPDAYLVWSEEIGDDWNVRAVRCATGGPGTPATITRHPGVDVAPSAALAGDTLWVAWTSNRSGERQVYACPVRIPGLEPGDPVRVSEAGGSAYEPSVAVRPGAAVAVAWHAFREHNYDVWLRERRSGTWGDPRRLTTAPTIDRNALLAVQGRELWVVWENARTRRYWVGKTDARRVHVARIGADGLLAPVEGERPSPLAGRTEAGRAVFDASGRLWLAWLTPRLPRAGWDSRLAVHGGAGWSPPVVLGAGKGLDRRPGLAILDDRVVVALQNDTIPGSWSGVDRTGDARSEILLSTVPLATAPPGGAPRVEPLVESTEPFEVASLRVAYGEDTPTPSTDYRGRRLSLYFGDLHEHTDISVCNRVGDQSVEESYQHMRDLARHDFACVTDHGYNLNPYLWSYTAKLARANDDPGRFLTFLGEEWTSSFEKYDADHPYGYYGHRNLILADSRFPRWWNARNGQTPAQVWEELRAMRADFVHIPHQLADTGNVPTDWDFVDAEAQPVAEIFQTRGSYEHEGAPRQAGRTTPERGHFLQDAWARGIVIGVIASPDHGGGYGKACVWAETLDRRSILAAIRARRCYGTTAAKIVLDVRVAGRMMGEVTSAAAPPAVPIEIHVRAPGEIDRVEICRSNRFVYAWRPEGREARLTYTDRDPLPGRSFYYVRVIQEDEEIAWSSPVWFGAE